MSEALMLAEALEERQQWPAVHDKAAAELRRQHALIQEMREALIAVNIQLVSAQRFAREVIAKAGEQT